MAGADFIQASVPRYQSTRPQGGWMILKRLRPSPAPPDSPRPLNAFGATAIMDGQQETDAFQSRSSQFGGPTTVQNLSSSTVGARLVAT